VGYSCIVVSPSAPGLTVACRCPKKCRYCSAQRGRMQPSPYLPLPALASRPPSVPLFSETVPFAGPYRYLPRLDVRLAARRNTVAVAVPTAAAATAASAARLHAALRSSSDFKRGGVPALSPLRPVKRTWRCCARMRVSPSRAGPPLPPPRWTGRRYAPCSPCSLLRARFLPPLFPISIIMIMSKIMIFFFTIQSILPFPIAIIFSIYSPLYLRTFISL